MSPTFERSARFLREFMKLPLPQRRAFLRARDDLVEALRSSPPAFPPHLRIKRVQGADGMWELTFAPDGRATFHYGTEIAVGEPPIVWLRVGTHSVLDDSSWARGATPVPTSSPHRPAPKTRTVPESRGRGEEEWAILGSNQ